MSAIPCARIAKTRSLPQADYRTQDPEVALMLRVRRDDAGAFGQLLERYWSQVYGRFYRRLGDRQEAEDLAQDVFLRLYRNRKRYQPRAKFSTWLYHITQNVLRNALRSRRRHPNLCLDSLACSTAFAEQFLPDRCEMPSHRLERAELAKIVRAAISCLALRQRTALELQQFENWSYAEVAAEMDMTSKATKSLLYRARNQLRACLAPFMEMSK